jgi:hypothetical protein
VGLQKVDERIFSEHPLDFNHCNRGNCWYMNSEQGEAYVLPLNGARLVAVYYYYYYY